MARENRMDLFTGKRPITMLDVATTYCREHARQFESRLTRDGKGNHVYSDEDGFRETGTTPERPARYACEMVAYNFSREVCGTLSTYNCPLETPLLWRDMTNPRAVETKKKYGSFYDAWVQFFRMNPTPR